jgi:hypothetical protein
MPKMSKAYLAPQTLEWMSPRRTPMSASNLSSSWCNWRTARLPATKFFIRTISPGPALNPTLRVVSRSIDNKVTLSLHFVDAAAQQLIMQISHGVFGFCVFAIKTGLASNYSKIMTKPRQFDEKTSCRKCLNKPLTITKSCVLNISDEQLIGVQCNANN